MVSAFQFTVEFYFTALRVTVTKSITNGCHSDDINGEIFPRF